MTRGRSSPQSIKPPGAPPNDTVGQGDPQWRVRIHPKVAKTIARYGGANSALFRPAIGDLIDALEIDPKRFPKKQGRLRDARAARLKFADGVVWRAVFTLDEPARIVRLIALAPHDDAYADAVRRV
ncbi:MAG: hypothetical protein NVS2B17_32670 [Candidatus Velthaea sp.]